MVRKWGDYEGTPRETNCVNEAFPAPPVTTSDAKTAFEQVLAGVGAYCPNAIPWMPAWWHGVRSGGGRIIDSQKEVGGWPELRSTAAPADSDNDGMPDDWETRFGLDPKNPADGAEDATVMVIPISKNI